MSMPTVSSELLSRDYFFFLLLFCFFWLHDKIFQSGCENIPRVCGIRLVRACPCGCVNSHCQQMREESFSGGSIFRSQGSEVSGVERRYEWLPYQVGNKRVCVCVLCLFMCVFCVCVCLRESNGKQRLTEWRRGKRRSQRDCDGWKYKHKHGTKTLLVLLAVGTAC